METWRPISGYDGDYEVSNLGRVRSFKENGYRILKQEALTGGYLNVFLSKNGKVKIHRVHRLVAAAFIPNPNSMPEVNRKDEDVTNNCAENLEWATPEYNRSYGTRTKRISESKKHLIEQHNKETGELISVFSWRGRCGKSRWTKSGKRHIRMLSWEVGILWWICLEVGVIMMKTETGQPTREQKWWVERLNKQGQFAEICHGWASAVRVLEWYLSLGRSDNAAT